ncbi:MAG: hypothetical protein LUJ09_04855 [Firmicutes bacterium]|nr:hypothetical protein [Bacillota bacterium]
MIDSKGIYRKADALIAKYGTRDPLVLAPQLGIQVNNVGDFRNFLGRRKKAGFILTIHLIGRRAMVRA